MKIKNVIIMIIVSVLLTGLMSIATLAGYPDVDNSDWYYNAVTSLTEEGIMDGYSDGNFYPDNQMTAADFIRIVYISFSSDEITEDEISIGWDKAYYNAALKKGIICSSDINESQINQYLCRYNAALIVSRALTGLMGEKVTIPAGMDSYVADSSRIPAYYLNPVYTVYSAGIMSGSSDGSFNGLDGISRAEAAQIIYRMKNKDMRLKLDSSKLSSVVEDDWFEDAMFIGDSLTHGLSLYSGLKTPDYFYSTGVSLRTVNTVKLESPSGCERSLYEALSGRAYGKVYILLGINQISSATESYYKAYGALIDTIRDYQPDAVIYLQTLLPVSRTKDASSTSFTKKNVEAFNEAICRLADEKGVKIVDIHSALVDEDGYLPEYATWDGVHLNSKYYKVWADYLRSNT